MNAVKSTRGGFLKNDASLSGLGHWFGNLGSLKNIIKKTLVWALLDIA